jgi:uncharacterized membrane protein YgcG
MRRVSAALSLAVILLASTAASAAQTNSSIKASLQKEIPSLNLSNVSFGDSIEFLRDITGLNINVNWKQLELLHVTKETPVNVRLRQISTRRALSLILAEAGGATPLTYYIDEGVIEITTQEAADTKMVTRVYDVSDLILEIPDFEGPSFSLSSQGGSGGGSGGGGNSGLLSGSGGGGAGGRTDEKGATKEQRGEELVKLITTTIRPEIWADAGGTAQIRFWRGRLIVTAPRSVQEMIGGSYD